MAEVLKNAVDKDAHGADPELTERVRGLIADVATPLLRSFGSA